MPRKAGQAAVSAKKAPTSKKSVSENLNKIEFEWSDEGMLAEHAPSTEPPQVSEIVELDLAAAQQQAADQSSAGTLPLQPESMTEPMQTEPVMVDLKAPIDPASLAAANATPAPGAWQIAAGQNGRPLAAAAPQMGDDYGNRDGAGRDMQRPRYMGRGVQNNQGRMGFRNDRNDRGNGYGNTMQNRGRMGFRQGNNQLGFSGELPDDGQPTEVITGILDTSKEGHGIVRQNFGESDRDAYISTTLLRRLKLLPGDVISGPARVPKENDRYWGMTRVDTVNGMTLEEFAKKGRVNFKSLTPVYPDEQLKLEIGKDPLSLRIIDMVAPIGKGQRSLIVSPPKAGKTTLLKDVATGVARNNPEIHVMAVLVGERPEEVTDIRRHVAEITGGKGEVAASNFDESAADQCRVAELALERAKRLVESGKDVLILLDSITRLARAYNLAMPTSGRTLSGGFDPAALFPPKKFFGAARNFEVPGSLTIIGTALVDTGSRMDDLVYEEFKGTGNQEVHLDRHLGERRVWPAIDVQKSGTRRDDLLIDPVTYQSIITLQRMLDMLDKEERTMTLIERMRRTDSNKEFLASLKG
jgi:transcription termination factor Rho